MTWILPRTARVVFLFFFALATLHAASLEPPQIAPGLPPAVNAGIRALLATQNFSDVAISPDGQRVAWISTPSASLYIQDLTGGVARRIIDAHGNPIAGANDPIWSPQGQRLAFLATDGSGQDQIYLAAGDGSSAHVLTHLKGNLADLKWSPNGTQLAVLFIENAPRTPGPLAPMSLPSGVIAAHPFEQRLAVVAVASGSVRQISPANLYVYQYDWSPNGKEFAATGAYGSGDNNWWIAQLYRINPVAGTARSILKPDTQIAEPRWSPDGRDIALIGGLMSDEGSTGGDIYLVPASGGQMRDVTPGMRATATWLTWSGDRILFAENVDGLAGIARLDPASGAVQTLWKGAESISGRDYGFSFAVARDGHTTALVRQSFAQPPAVWAGAIGAWRQLTHANDILRPAWGPAKSLDWTSGGFRVQGWLLYPRDYDPHRRYGLVVSVHGGPAAANTSSWPRAFFNTSLLSTAGYFVLYPNPRGSYGQGEAFTRANVKDFGYGDLRDILAGVDLALKTAPVDARRVGITGWSYGGYMTMWAITQTHRFRAAVAGAGVADWKSYYGENDIDQWMIPYFGASVYADPAVYAKSAPINFIRNVATPTLILVGDRDGECPEPQSAEYWHALQTLGVTNEFVVYPDEGHFIWKADDERDIVRRTIAWFDQYLR